MPQERLDAIEKALRELAGRHRWTDNDDFDPCGMSGGKYDDAYYGGCDDGETTLARELLEKFFGNAVLEANQETP